MSINYKSGTAVKKWCIVNNIVPDYFHMFVMHLTVLFLKPNPNFSFGRTLSQTNFDCNLHGGFHACIADSLHLAISVYCILLGYV